MTLVRVNEETLNISHSSNLISAIGLETPHLPNMRSIRVGGCTLARVVVHFHLLESKREQERGRA
jgi:hypothetical protein